MSKSSITLDLKDLPTDTTIIVKLERFKQWQLRLWIATQLIWLASKIAWVDIEIQFIDKGEPWLYYCPKCGKDICDGKDALSVRCHHCNYQSLVIQNIEGKPYCLDPSLVEDGAEFCSWGCHYAEPYGFVPMADCPIHDRS